MEDRRQPDGAYIIWAKDKLSKLGYQILGDIIDQHGLRLGCRIVFPSGKRGYLLVGGKAVKEAWKGVWYSKSLDCHIVLKVIEEDGYLMLALHDEDKLYYTTGEALKNYLDETTRTPNIHRSLKECFSTSPPICPICQEPRKLHEKTHERHHRPAYGDLIEVFNWRPQFCFVPLKEIDMRSPDPSVRLRPTPDEIWLYTQFKKDRLPLIRTAEFRDPYIKAQFGWYPDFIPTKGNLLIGIDTSTPKQKIVERTELAKQKGYRLYSIRNLPKIRQECEQGNPKKLRDLLDDIKNQVERPLDKWIHGGGH